MRVDSLDGNLQLFANGSIAAAQCALLQHVQLARCQIGLFGVCSPVTTMCFYDLFNTADGDLTRRLPKMFGSQASTPTS